MNTERQPQIEGLLETYPNLRVHRERLGEVAVSESLPNGHERIMYVFISREGIAEGAVPNIGINTWIRNSRGENDSDHTFIIVQPKDDENASVIEMEKQEPLSQRRNALKDKKIDPKAVVTSVNNGLKILDEYLKLTPEDNQRYSFSIRDEMAGHNIPEKVAPRLSTASLEQLGASQLDTQYMFMQYVLSRNIDYSLVSA